MRELLRLRGVHELHHVGCISEAADPALFAADGAANAGKDIESDGGAIVAGLVHGAAKSRLAFGFIVLLDELTDLINDGDGVQVALALGVAPGEEAVAAKNNAVAAGVLLDRALEHHGQLKSG